VALEHSHDVHHAISSVIPFPGSIKKAATYSVPHSEPFLANISFSVHTGWLPNDGIPLVVVGKVLDFYNIRKGFCNYSGAQMMMA